MGPSLQRGRGAPTPRARPPPLAPAGGHASTSGGAKSAAAGWTCHPGKGSAPTTSWGTPGQADTHTPLPAARSCVAWRSLHVTPPAWSPGVRHGRNQCQGRAGRRSTHGHSKGGRWQARHARRPLCGWVGAPAAKWPPGSRSGPARHLSHIAFHRALTSSVVGMAGIAARPTECSTTSPSGLLAWARGRSPAIRSAAPSAARHGPTAVARVLPGLA